MLGCALIRSLGMQVPTLKALLGWVSKLEKAGELPPPLTPTSLELFIRWRHLSVEHVADVLGVLDTVCRFDCGVASDTGVNRPFPIHWLPQRVHQRLRDAAATEDLPGFRWEGRWGSSPPSEAADGARRRVGD